MGGLFSKPKLPEIEDPVTIPDEDDEAIARARQREVTAQRARQGAQSTILTERQAGPQGREFSRTLLG